MIGSHALELGNGWWACQDLNLGPHPCAAGAAGVPQKVPTSGTSTWDFSLALGEGGHRPAAALVSSSAVRQAVPGAWLVDPPLEPRRNQRDHDRYQVDAALVADHVHILALVDEA
jgi:hypothetical protein